MSLGDRRWQAACTVDTRWLILTGFLRRCVAKPALLYAHFWPAQAHTDTDQQLSAACISIAAPNPDIHPSPISPACSLKKSSICFPAHRMLVQILSILSASPKSAAGHLACCIQQQLRNNNQLVTCLLNVYAFLKLSVTIADVDDTCMIWPKVGRS